MVNNKNNFIRILIICMGSSFLVFYILSFYNFPSADDYNYTIATSGAWNATYSIFNLIGEALKTSVDFWNRWQGLYTSAFVLSLSPHIFGENMYFIGSCVLISLCIYAFIFFWKNIQRTKNRNYILFGLVHLFIVLNYMPDMCEGIYWYNGAMNYTFFFALMIIMFGIILKNVQRYKISDIVFINVLAFLISGGNHITAFQQILLICIVIFMNIYYRNIHKLKSNITTLITMLGGFGLNIFSPGTQVRVNAIPIERNMALIIYESMKYALEFVRDNLFQVETVLFLVIICSYTIYRKEDYSWFEKVNPLVSLTVGILFLSASYCPVVYGLGTVGGGRVQNVIFYVFTFFLIFICMNITVRIQIKFERKILAGRMGRHVNKFLITAIILLGIITGTGITDSNFYLATRTILKGEAVEYADENNYRIKLLKEGIKIVDIPRLKTKPILLYNSDISDDETYWTNLSVARYYGLEGVRTSRE